MNIQRRIMKVSLLCAAFLSCASTVQAQIVFGNNFETDTAGFTSSGSLPALTRVSLPTDSAGLASANQSMWLGRLGSGIAKSGSVDEIVTLNLTGLTPGTVY